MTGPVNCRRRADDNSQALIHYAKGGQLPQVSWINPNAVDSERTDARLTTGVAYVTNMINTIMRDPDWNSTAIFLAWDDWGGFYDHVVPPHVDQKGALIVSLPGAHRPTPESAAHGIPPGHAGDDGQRQPDQWLR